MTFKKFKLILPFLIIPIITPIYLYLHVNVFIDIFGCGCVPSTETNILNIPFNTNDLRLVVYAILIILATALSVIFSKSFEDKKKRFWYCAITFITATFISLIACSLYIWK